MKALRGKKQAEDSNGRWRGPGKYWRSPIRLTVGTCGPCLRLGTGKKVRAFVHHAPERMAAVLEASGLVRATQRGTLVWMLDLPRPISPRRCAVVNYCIESASMDAKTHWERVYTTKEPEAVSWYRPLRTLKRPLSQSRGRHTHTLSPSLTLAVVNQHFALRAELFGIRTPVCGLIRQSCRVVTMSHTQISLYPMRSDSNTTLLPSGEKLGLPLNPFADKIRVGGGGSVALVFQDELPDRVSLFGHSISQLVPFPRYRWGRGVFSREGNRPS